MKGEKVLCNATQASFESDKKLHLEHAIPLFACDQEDVRIFCDGDTIENVRASRTTAFWEDGSKVYT